MIIKKIATISASLLILFSSVTYGDDFYTVYDLTEKTQLSTGISYEKIEKFTSQGWMNINIIRANLTDEYTKIKPITNENGVSNRSPLSNMVEKSDAIAGVNGDFFYMGNPTYTYGALIDNGNIITTPLPSSYGYPTISRTLDGNVDISLWNPKITLYGANDSAYDILVFNKTSSIDWGATILTSDWNNISPGYVDKDIIEIIVVNNTVSEIRKNMPSTTIPENGYIIASSHPETIESLSNSFFEGGPSYLNIELDFSPENLEWAFGGLNYLVENGQIKDISKEVLGTHPRTAVGFNQDNTEMILVTVDGRNKAYTSITQTELAQIMKDLGAYNVVNMDGGGSTTMAVKFLKNANITVVNLPSDGIERRIASGVGVFDTSPESYNVNSIEINTSNEFVFNNTELPISLKFYNEYNSMINYDINNVVFNVEPANAGKVENGIFKPLSPGKATINASVGGITGKLDIEVLDSPVSLNFSFDNISLGYGQTYNIGEALGTDKNGQSAYIPAKYINFTYRNKVGTVLDGVFTAGNVNSVGAITANFNGAVKNIFVKVGFRYKTLNSFENLNGIKLTLYPESSPGNISISNSVVKEGNNSLKLDYDFTQMTDQSIAFIDFTQNENGILLEDKPIAIGMWVYGDGKNHWLRGRVTDSNGVQSKITFEDEVNWTGWKWVTANIPTGISYPITLNNIYLAEINELRKDSGTIYIDNLRILYNLKDKELSLPAETKFIDSKKTSIVNSFSEKLVVKNNSKSIINQNNIPISGTNIVYYDGIITNGSLNGSNITMWNNIKTFLNYNDKVLVLCLNQPFDNIYDNREIKVLKEILTKASENNEVYVIWQGNTENTFIENNVRYIEYSKTFEIGVTNNGTFYKN